MAVYIFPIDQSKRPDAKVFKDKIKTLTLTPKNTDPFYREEARKVWVRAGAELPEIPIKDSIIVVDPALGFTATDIADDFSFGNGTTVGGVRLKDERWVDCGFVVFDHADKAKADGMLTALRNIFKGLA